MTNIGKENIIKRIQNSGLFNDFIATKAAFHYTFNTVVVTR